MKATAKSTQIENFLSLMTGKNRIEVIEDQRCTTCNGQATHFRDALSEREYTISGMCQECQDSVFGR